LALIPVHAKSQETTEVTLFLQESLDAKGQRKPLNTSTEKLLDFLERETGLRFVRQSVPWNRARLLTSEGRGIIWGFSKSPERLKQFNYSQVVLASRIWAIAYTEPRFNLKKIDDLKGKVISVERGVSHGMEFELAKNTVFKIDEDTSSSLSRFKKLVAQRCDILLMGGLSFESSVQVEEYLNKEYIPKFNDVELSKKVFYVSSNPLFSDTIHFAAAKGHFESVLQKIDHALARGKKSGELQAIEKQFELRN
jgi:ABC-type amino acid transport substrate-binding protein